MLAADGRPRISIVINAMGRLELAEYGVRSWLLQDVEIEYEVVLNLFSNERKRFDDLSIGISTGCAFSINVYEPPAFFNISAANNIGIFHSRGEYVFFANADVIYPSNTLRRLVDAAARFDAHFAVCSRHNLSPENSAQLAPANTYNLGGFDFLEAGHYGSSMIGTNGWLCRRTTLLEIGGFNPSILVCEDMDISFRIMDYCRRHNLQPVELGFCDIFGYHVYHASSEIFDAMDEAKERISELKLRAANDPSAAVYFSGADLGAIDSLVYAIANTKKPISRYRRNVFNKAIKRLKNAIFVLVGRRIA